MLYKRLHYLTLPFVHITLILLNLYIGQLYRQTLNNPSFAGLPSQDAVSREIQVINERKKEVKLRRKGNYYSEKVLREEKKVSEQLSKHIRNYQGMLLPS